MLSKIISILLSLLVLFFLWTYFKKNPKAFASQNWNKSFFTMGVLALLLIGFVALLVFYLRMG